MYKILKENKIGIIIGVITSLIFYIISVIIPAEYVKMRVDVPVGMIVMIIILAIIYIKYSEGKKIVKLKKKVDYFKSNIIKLQNKNKIDLLSEYTEENYNLDSHGLYDKSILFGWSYTEDYEIKDIYTIDAQIENEQISPVNNRYYINIPIREYNLINNVFEYNGSSEYVLADEYDIIKMCAIANIECKVNKLKQQCNERIIHQELANINI